MTHRDTVIRIEPPRKDAAPNKAYLKTRNGITYRHTKIKKSITYAIQGQERAHERCKIFLRAKSTYRQKYIPLNTIHTLLKKEFIC